MLIIISPSKTQDFETEPLFVKGVVSAFNTDTEKLSQVMKKYSSEDLMKMMKISSKLADLNFDRFQGWNKKFLKEDQCCNSTELKYSFKPAIFAFKGDVYHGFNLKNYSKEDFAYVENNLRIISGFYGLMTPATYLKPYRLEMGVKVSFMIGGRQYKNLYDFWGDKLTNKLRKDFEKVQTSSEKRYILNLASVEYSKSIDIKSFGDDVINVDFKIFKNGAEKIVAIFAKKQRGEMANWVIQNRVESITELKKYKNAGFKFSLKSTKEAIKKTGEQNRLVFVK